MEVKIIIVGLAILVPFDRQEPKTLHATHLAEDLKVVLVDATKEKGCLQHTPVLIVPANACISSDFPEINPPPDHFKHHYPGHRFFNLAETDLAIVSDPSDGKVELQGLHWLCKGKPSDTCKERDTCWIPPLSAIQFRGGEHHIRGIKEKHRASSSNRVTSTLFLRSGSLSSHTLALPPQEDMTYPSFHFDWGTDHQQAMAEEALLVIEHPTEELILEDQSSHPGRRRRIHLTFAEGTVAEDKVPKIYYANLASHCKPPPAKAAHFKLYYSLMFMNKRFPIFSPPLPCVTENCATYLRATSTSLCPLVISDPYP